MREFQVTGEAPLPNLREPSWRGYFIWYPEGAVDNATRYFRRSFSVPETAVGGPAHLQIAADDAYTAWLNGRRLGSGDITPRIFDLAGLLRPGRNVLAVMAREETGAEGLLAEIDHLDGDGRVVATPADDAWRASREAPEGWTGLDFDDAAWSAAARSSTLPNYAANIRYHNFAVAMDDAFTLLGLDLPAEVRPGDRLEGTARLRCRRKPAADYGFRVAIADEPLTDYTRYAIALADAAPAPATSQWEAGEVHEVPFALAIPSWAPHGVTPLRVRALAADGEAPVAAERETTVKIIRFAEEPTRRGKPVRALLRPRTGAAPELVVDGQVMPPMIFGLNSYNHTFREYGEHAAIATGLYRLSPKGVALTPPEGVGEDEHYAKVGRQLDQAVGQALRVFPHAYFLLTLDTRVDYSASHPEDALTLSDGRRTMHSFSSRRWVDACRLGVTRVITHLRAADYAGHIAGVVLASGAGGETMYWNAHINAPDTPREQVAAGDFSPAAEARLREYLRRRYAGDVDALRRAWRRPDVDFDNAPPEIGELRRADFGQFRDPAAGRMAMDYWQSHSDAVADGLAEIAEAAKDASDGEWLVGVWGFYSLAQYPIMSCNNPAALHHLGGSSLHRVLAAPAIDLVAAIQSYIGVRAGTPVVTTLPTASFRKHGKVFVEEFDVRTFWTDLGFSHSHTTSQHETDQVLKRDFAAAFARGDHCWFVGFTRGYSGRQAVGWYSDERLTDGLNLFARIGRAAEAFDRPSGAEVAVFANNRDVTSLDLMNSAALLVNAQFNTVYRELAPLAAPFDAYLLDDCAPKTLEPYKVAIFLNAFYLPAARRDAIRAALESRGKTALFLYAPGYVEPETGIDAAGIEAFTGIRVAALDESRDNLRVRVDGGGFTAHEFGPYKYDYARQSPVIAPVFHIDDDAATVLGRYVHDGRVALARKKAGGMTSYYCAVPLASRTLFADIFREAGVHRYADAPLYAAGGGRFLAVHAPAAYRGALRLPRDAWAFECFGGQRPGDGGRALEVDIPAGESRLYFFGDRDEVDAFSRQLAR